LRIPPFLKVVKSYVVGNGFKVQRKEGSKDAKYTKGLGFIDRQPT